MTDFEVSAMIKAHREGKNFDEVLSAIEGVSKAVEDAVGDVARFASGERRSSLSILTTEEIELIKSEFAAIGGDPNMLVFDSSAKGTCYVDATNKIYIKGDIFPFEDAVHPRSTMSPRAVLAHEYYGHAINRGTPVEATM